MGSSKRWSQSGSSRRSKPSSGRHEEEPPPTRPPLSFLFVVNELHLADIDHRDEYHHQTPPTDPRGYTIEIPSQVMRYQNGNISVAAGCQWFRQPDDGERYSGSIYYTGEGGEPTEAVSFRNSAVFACNPLLPIMVCPADPFSTPTRGQWELLQIFHPSALPGVSQVAFEESDMPMGPGLMRYIASSQPSWVPSLIPLSYKWPYNRTPQAPRGLGGELSIILGLMALSAEPDSTNQNQGTHATFLGARGHAARWTNGRWSCSRARGHPLTGQDPPRGFLVSISLDPMNPQGSTREDLQWFQWNFPIVT